METRPYEVEYTNGAVRVKMFSADGAKAFRYNSDVKDVRLPGDAPSEHAEEEHDLTEDRDEMTSEEESDAQEDDVEAKQATTRPNKSRRARANK